MIDTWVLEHQFIVANGESLLEQDRRVFILSVVKVFLQNGWSMVSEELA